MKPSPLAHLLAIVIVLFVSGASSQDQPPPGDQPPLDEKTEAARASEAASVARMAAEAYRVTTGGAGGTALQLEPEALLRWSNPAGGSFHGSVFVWTAKGRPEVVASIYKKYLPLPRHLGVEFHSLSDRPATAERDGHADWSLVRGGVEFRPVPGAPAPADTPARRLRQMRDMAAGFSSTKTDRKALTRPLRLLTQPVYRHEGTDPGAPGGALFAFVEGTDPEVILLIETRPGDKGPAWQYALARMNSVEFHVRHQGGEVWSVPVIPWSQAKDPREPYTLITFLPGEGLNRPVESTAGPR